ncbi:LCP family protein [Lysinibacillus piscis]|uniref:Cell envelope-related transcriptional attenuator domain-containing protein n=1 Tax=Lysinibacillus piscis TaxID=2518931 RepID=A0ABQ5NN58_9BACI|nr:LCP family protein [Lysinibacillus sp. KH24]GLC89675.1 hypothetical protein LYSBPC_28020 [Lysinibacillus sp. KH24]
MEDRRLKDKLFTMSEQDLQFTKEDRHAVFEQLHQLETHTAPKKSLTTLSKKFAPFTVSLIVVGLCIFLFMPSILHSNFNKEANTGIVGEPVVEEPEILTTLITVKSKEMDNRIYLNLLLTYSKNKKMLKVVSLPYNTYAPIANNSDGTTLYDKLLFAYRFGGAENVKATVSKLVNLPIDYYAVIDLETISTLVDTVDGIDYELSEDIRVRAITKVAFDLEKGLQGLNGEGVVALMMAASEGNGSDVFDEENLLKLLNAVMSKAKSDIPSTQLKELFTQLETNTSLDNLLKNYLEIHSTKLVSLRAGMIPDIEVLSDTEGKYYITFEQDFVKSIVRELTTFD